jgi:hypothetical protein
MIGSLREICKEPCFLSANLIWQGPEWLESRLVGEQKPADWLASMQLTNTWADDLVSEAMAEVIGRPINILSWNEDSGKIMEHFHYPKNRATHGLPGVWLRWTGKHYDLVKESWLIRNTGMFLMGMESETKNVEADVKPKRIDKQPQLIT